MFFFNIGSILGVARSSAEALSEALSEALLEARRLSDAPKSQGIALARDVDRSVFSQQTHQLGIYINALCVTTDGPKSCRWLAVFYTLAKS